MPYIIQPPEYHPSSRFPLGANAKGIFERKPRKGIRVKGEIVGYRQSVILRWVVKIKNTIGTPTCPKDDLVYNIHEEKVELL